MSATSQLSLKSRDVLLESWPVRYREILTKYACAKQKTTYTGSSHEYSLGQRRRPVLSFSNPRSSLEFARNPGFEGPYMLSTHTTTALLRRPVSSLRAPSAPVRNYITISRKHPDERIRKGHSHFCKDSQGTPHRPTQTVL
jgi:hypothetical protein